MGRISLISGLTGMDGSHTADLLLSKGYKVYGLVRRSASSDLWRIQHILKDIELVQGDLCDQSSLDRIIGSIKPDELYNLAAQSFVKHSFEAPEYTAEVTGLGALRVFEAVRNCSPKTRVYQASSSEMYGNSFETIQTELTPFSPCSPYGAAKLFAHNMAITYRNSYKLFIACGIAFNHESERRGLEFVSRKITDGVARIKLGLTDRLTLGNLDTKRDFGYAPDYCEAFHKMLQEEEPQDYVIATGKTYSVKDFIKQAFEIVELDWTKYVKQDERYMRPSEVHTLCGWAKKIEIRLRWEPKTDFIALVKIMVAADLERLSHASQPCNTSQR